MKRAWKTLKERDASSPLVERDARSLLARPRFIGGLPLNTGSWWNAQDIQDLKILADAGATAAAAASALGRSAKSIAWYAKDALDPINIPANWRHLIRPPRLKVPAQPRLFMYPYLPSLPKAASFQSGAEILMKVSGIVSRAFPDFMRADICQTIILAILEGNATIGALEGSPDLVRSFVRQYRRSQDALPGGGMRDARSSFDAPRWDDGNGDRHESYLPAGIMGQLEW